MSQFFGKLNALEDAMRYLSDIQRETLLMLIACNPEIGVKLSQKEERILMNEPFEDWPNDLRELLGPWKPVGLGIE